MSQNCNNPDIFGDMACGIMDKIFSLYHASVQEKGNPLDDQLEFETQSSSLSFQPHGDFTSCPGHYTGRISV